MKAGYTLEGEPLEPYTNLAFLAPVWALFRVSQALHGSLGMHACFIFHRVGACLLQSFEE